jgi:hypothetical protein
MSHLGIEVNTSESHSLIKNQVESWIRHLNNEQYVFLPDQRIKKHIQFLHPNI